MTELTPLQQHQAAMAHGGYSPFFGWILNGKQVSKQDYWQARDREDKYAEAAGTLWN
jgi:hypothetical protein